MKSLKAVLPVGGVFSVALLVRLLYNLTVGQGYLPKYDAYLYYKIAGNMLTEHCYCYNGALSTVSRAPLWSFIMAGIYAMAGWNPNPHVLFGGDPFYARLFYAFLGSGTCVLVYLFARDLFGKRIGLITGMIAAIYCGLFLYDGFLFTESLYTFLLTFFVYALYRLQMALPNYPQWEDLRGLKGFWCRYSWAIVGGIVLGLMTLSRPNGVGFLLLLGIWAACVMRVYRVPCRMFYKSMLLLACIAGCLVAPWTVRNYRVTHAFVLVATGMGEVLLGAYNDNMLYPNSSGMWRPPAGAVIHDDPRYTPQNDAADTACALAWMRAHPTMVPYLMGLHLVNMWKPYNNPHATLPMEEFPDRLSSQILWKLIPLETVPIFIMAGLGLMVTLKKRGIQLTGVYLVLGFTLAENIVFYGSTRFRAPIEPLLVLFAGGFLWWVSGALFQRYKGKRISQPIEAI